MQRDLSVRDRFGRPSSTKSIVLNDSLEVRPELKKRIGDNQVDCDTTYASLPIPDSNNSCTLIPAYYGPAML